MSNNTYHNFWLTAAPGHGSSRGSRRMFGWRRKGEWRSSSCQESAAITVQSRETCSEPTKTCKQCLAKLWPFQQTLACSMVPTTCGEASQHHNQEHLEMCEGTGYKSRGLDMIGLSGILDFWRRMTSRLNGGLYMYWVICSICWFSRYYNKW